MLRARLDRNGTVGRVVTIFFILLLTFVIISVFRSSLEPTIDITVVDVSIIAQGNTNLLTATVRNTGTIALENVVLSALDDEGKEVMLVFGKLAPGETRGAENWEGRWTVGSTYIVRISFRAAGKGELIKAFTEVAG
jgi:hypothetical protein